MSIETRTINKEQSERILSLQEDHFNDLKSKLIQPKKLTRTISAFCNADGGDVYIGIDEIKDDNHRVTSRKWNGFETLEDANGHIQVFAELFPFSGYFAYCFLEKEDESGFVLHINVNKNNAIIKASDGKPYVRKGAQNIPINTLEELRRLEFDKGITTFERQTLYLPKETITESEIIESFIERVIPSSTSEKWLKKQLLIQNELPTVAGVLLFSDIPQAALPKQSAVKIYRYKTRDFEGKRETLAFDPITVEGPIYSQIYDSVRSTIEIVEQIKILTESGLDNIRYPSEALHEIITNAILHRDYSITKDVHIRIFDNRIEVESPGKLPGHITVNNILNEQFARNGTLVRIINKFPNPPNKDVGEGLNTAFESLRKLRLKNPDIVEKENSLIVIVKHEPLASPEELVMKYISVHKVITNSIGREITGIDSENEMKRVFQRLQTKDLIYLDPDLKGSASRWLLREDHQDVKKNGFDNGGIQTTLFD